MKESELERALVSEVKREGGEAFKWVSPGNSGVPDRIVMLPDGRIYFVEMKSGRGTLRPVQAKVLERIRALGQEAVIVKGEDALIAFFEEIGRQDAAERLRARFGRR